MITIAPDIVHFRREHQQHLTRLAVRVLRDGSYNDPNYRPPVGYHYVNGYFRSTGTYVSGHYRTNRDNSFWNNYSSEGNVNPYTGKVGTRRK